MVSGRSRREHRVVAELPDLPEEFEAAPDAVQSGTNWDGVCADASLTVPEHVHDVELVECLWREVDAASCRFSGFRCRDVRFERCDLSGAVLDNAALTRVHFLECRLTGVVLGGAELSDVVIERGVAGLANFRGSTSSFLSVRATPLVDADFTGARLRNAALLDCELRGIDLTGAGIEGLSLHGSTLDSIRGVSALLGAGLRIDADQVIPLGAALIGALGVTVAPRPEQS